MKRRSAILAGVVAISLLSACADSAQAGQGPEGRFRSAGPRAAQASQAEPAAAAPGEVIALSNERTLSRWAFVDEPTLVHERPDPSSQVIDQLRVRTHDRTSELVLALSETTVEQESWVEVRFKHRPNNVTGWVRRSALGGFNEVTTVLKIWRSKLRAALFRNGRKVWSAPVGVGKSIWPTPRGRFYVRERLIPIDRAGTYGVFAFGTSATSPVLTDWPGGGIIGIHGTNQPGLIPGRISHGCIRIRNGKIDKLRRLLALGTPIKVI